MKRKDSFFPGDRPVGIEGRRGESRGKDFIANRG